MNNLNNDVIEEENIITEEEFINKMCSKEDPIEDLIGSEVISNDGKSIFKITNAISF